MAGMDCEVVIVGGGPVGSLGAYLLALAGVEVVLVDEHLEPALDYRASTFHPPTLDLLEDCGVTPALMSMGLICPTIQYRDRRNGPIGELDLSVLRHDTRHPYRLQCEQFKLTRWLHARLDAMPSARIERGRRAVAVEPDADGVTVRCHDDVDEQSWRSRYVIGCDGARSTVRKALSIAFDGYTHPEHFLVTGSHYDFKAAMRDIQSVNYTSDPDEWFLLLEIPDMWRIIVPVPPEVSANDARSDDYIQRCLRNICPTDGDFEILVKAIYRVHQRAASSYRVGVVLLAGDAAHVNNPIGGMGLNGGLHDILELVDCLLQARKSGHVSDLDRYEARRRPIAIDDINAMTERNKRMLEERNLEIRGANNNRLRAICGDPALSHDLALDVSMIRSLRRSGQLGAATA